VPALELVDQALREPWRGSGRLGPGGQFLHAADYTWPIAAFDFASTRLSSTPG